MKWASGVSAVGGRKTGGSCLQSWQVPYFGSRRSRIWPRTVERTQELWISPISPRNPCRRTRTLTSTLPKQCARWRIE